MSIKPDEELLTENVEKILRAVWWYYVDGFTQGQIAKELNVSRASVGRILEKARSTGLVNISIEPTLSARMESASRVKKAFGLKDVLILPSTGSHDLEEDDVLRRLAIGAVQVLRERIKAGDRLGIGWGRTVATACSLMPSDMLEMISFASLTGGVTPYINSLMHIGNKRNLSSKDEFIPTPIVISDTDLASRLREEQGVKTALEAGENSQIALIGIGALNPDATFVSNGYATKEELNRFREQGAVGDLLGVFYDREGVALDLPLHKRRIGIEIETLKSIPTVIGVASGLVKVQAIYSALRGNYLDVLVTDENVANELLNKYEYENTGVR